MRSTTSRDMSAVRRIPRDDRHNLDRPPIGGDVELEVHRPHPVGRIRAHRGRSGGGAVTFTSPPLRHPQPFLTPKPLDLLVIDDPTLAAGVMVGRPKPAA